MLPFNVAAETPTLRLPTQTVTMKVVYVWQDSYFKMTLTNVPAGYDITDGEYPGWCVEVATEMTTGVNHKVQLYSSYDAHMPESFKSAHWDKVNYIINNRDGYDRQTIQEVIWYFICKDPLPANNSNAVNLAAEANASGAGFVPTFGQKIAVLAFVTNTQYLVQRSFFEFTLRPAVALGDFVWNDLNNNGVQDNGEPGLQGITIRLLNETGATLNTTTTNSYGYYSFSGYEEGNYSLQFVIKASNYRFSPANKADVDDALDSDADKTTGKTEVFTAFTPGVNDMSWDAGMYQVEESGNSGSPGTPTPPPAVPNQAPTADGTAGEPYVILFDEQPIWFNASRSVDSDGTIVSYHWIFGDGATADGKIVNHTYTSPGNYSVNLTVTDNDGAKDYYTTNAHIRLPNVPPLPPTLTGSQTGSADEIYVLHFVTTDSNNDNIKYMVTWGDGTYDTTALLNSGEDSSKTHQWASWGFYTIQVYAEDDFANATSNLSRLTVAVDVLHIGAYGYLIDTDSNGEYDAFYSNSTGSQTTATRQQTGVYLIDTNGDGKADLQYDPTTQATREYPEALSTNYTMLLLGLVIAIVVVLIIAFVMRRRWKKP